MGIETASFAMQDFARVVTEGKTVRRSVDVRLLLLAASLALLQGCAAMVGTGAVGAAGVAGVATATDRRSAGAVVDDEVIELKALAALRRNDDIAPNSHINATSYNGILLLTGETLNEDTRRQITQLVENIDKVRRVHNELAIAAPSSMLSRSSDSVITAKIKTALGRHSFEIAARTKVVTENGVVYLMGVVRRSEADVSTNIARKIGGVQRVVKLFEYIE